MRKNFFFAVMVALVAMALSTSCKKEEPITEEPNPYAEKIVGLWELDPDNTFVVRIYTSAAGESSADTIALSSGGSIMEYEFGDDGKLVVTTTAADGSASARNFDYQVKGEKLIFDGITHFIVVLDDEDLVFEQRQHQDYRSGEQLDYNIHYSLLKSEYYVDHE